MQNNTKEGIISKIICLECGSDRTMRCEMAYYQNTSSGFSIGAAINSNKNGINIVPISAITQSQTRIARLVGPPTPPGKVSPIGIVIGLLLSIIPALLIASNSISVQTGMALIVLSPIVIGSMCYILLSDRDAEKQSAWENEMILWRSKWICLDCGAIWLREAEKEKSTDIKSSQNSKVLDVHTSDNCVMHYKSSLHPIHSAARSGNLELIESEIQNGIPIDLKSPSGFTPLHLAALNGHLLIVQWLIAKGANIAMKDSKGWTAYDYAKNSSNDAICACLTKCISL